jgi:hypothetical protein
MPNIRRVDCRRCDPPDREPAASVHQLTREWEAGFDLGPSRRAIGIRGSRVRRHDVPQQHVLVEAELREHAVHDRRGRLGRPSARELPLGRERDARDARAAVAGRLTDDQDRRVGALLEVARETLSQSVVSVLVERVADSRSGEAVYQRSQRTTSSSERRRCDMRLDARLAFGSGLPRPIVTPATTATSSGMPSNSLNVCISGTVTP